MNFAGGQAIGTWIWRAGAYGSALLIFCAGTTPAWAHAGAAGFVLLLPTELYILGGALAVFVSFIVLAALHRGGVAPPPTEGAQRQGPRPGGLPGRPLALPVPPPLGPPRFLGRPG